MYSCLNPFLSFFFLASIAIHANAAILEENRAPQKKSPIGKLRARFAALLCHSFDVVFARSATQNIPFAPRQVNCFCNLSPGQGFECEAAAISWDDPETSSMASCAGCCAGVWGSPVVDTSLGADDGAATSTLFRHCLGQY